MYGCQCTKRLFLHKFNRGLRNPYDEKQQAIFDAGTSIGELSQKLFPYGVDASPPNLYSYHLSVAKTKALIDRGVDVIYEAAFQYEGVLCALDILVKNGNAWYAFEVKSKTSVKEQHVQDAALQYYVVKHCGLPIEDISIIYLNNQYVRHGELDVKKLFATESVLENVLTLQDYIENKVFELKALLSIRQEPVIDIGPHCVTPYECDFTNHCWAHMPKENSVLSLARGVGWKLLGEGYKHLDEIPNDYELGNTASMQLAHYRTGEVHIEKDEIERFLEPLVYPLYFFDFETIMPGIPEFDDSRPYQQIPFQFSLHVQRIRNGEVEHHAFLGDGINDPRLRLTEVMLKALGESGSIICYNMSFEKSRIRELAELYPEHATKLLAIHDRIFDLMIPFQKRWYYHPEFRGSYSIKVVLPVLVPELRYDALEIQEGGMASLVYAQLKKQKPEIADAQRLQLLEYCKMDTLAMVRILEFLKTLNI